jgi:hypothetical protein
MQYLLDCPCGRKVPVQRSQAGENVTCECGSEFRVPSLSKLRELSGIAPYESSVLDTIQGMVERGELPAGDVCALSGTPTRDTLDVSVVVPIAFQGREGPAGVFMTLWWAPLFDANWLSFLSGVFQVVFGQTVPVEDSDLPQHRARMVSTPLRISSQHQAKLRRASQRRLKRLLRTVPVYAQLLDENPVVRIAVVATSANSLRGDTLVHFSDDKMDGVG